MEENNCLARSEKLYLSLVALFCTFITLSNLITVKLFNAPIPQGLALPAGLITYPLSFIVSDLVTEIYGNKRAKMMVYLGFAMSFVSVIIIQFAIHLPAFDPKNQETFEAAFGMNSIAVFGSMSAYVVAQIIDIKIFSWIKTKTQNRHLWLRNNASTLVSQFMDSVIVDMVIFYFGFGYSLEAVGHVILSSYAYKAFFSVANTPIFYLAVDLARKFLKKDQQIALTSTV